MKHLKTIIIAVWIAVLCLSSLSASDKAMKDKDLLIGTWSVAEGIYADNSVEKELEMSFVIKASAMSNPMDDSEMPYTLDEKTRTIVSKADKTSMKIVYRVVDNNTVEFTEMTVTSDKSTQIVGPKGTFKLLKLKRGK